MVPDDDDEADVEEELDDEEAAAAVDGDCVAEFGGVVAITPHDVTCKRAARSKATV